MKTVNLYLIKIKPKTYLRQIYRQGIGGFQSNMPIIVVAEYEDNLFTFFHQCNIYEVDKENADILEYIDRTKAIINEKTIEESGV